MLCAQLAYMHRSQDPPGRMVTPTARSFRPNALVTMGGNAEHILRAVLTRGARATLDHVSELLAARCGLTRRVYATAILMP
jgi:hypothetical protein